MFRVLKAIEIQMTSKEVMLGDHRAYMRLAMAEAMKSVPSSRKFSVGAVLVDGTSGEVLSSGYSCEYGDGGGGHFAECCCYIKLMRQHGVSEQDLARVLPANCVLYKTMEPGNARLGDGGGCASLLTQYGHNLRVVYVGIREPNTFISGNSGKALLHSHGMNVAFPVPDLSREIYQITTRCHGVRLEN
jgi:pyrimidine deaminase RibD-like protein